MGCPSDSGYDTSPSTRVQLESMFRHPLHDVAARLTLDSCPQTYLPVTVRLV